MSSATDILNLNKMEVFQNLKKQLEKRGTNFLQNLIAFKDQILYVWNSEECCLYAILLSTAHEKNIKYKKLYPGTPPLFDVNEILINEPGTLCALVGTKGVSVMRFPKRMGTKSLYDGTGEGISCSTSLLQDKYFVSKHLTDIKRVRWYPGSPEDNHLIVLTNDKNCLRLFKVENNLGKLASVWQLGPQSSRLSVSLGDTAVDFDFAPPVLLGEKVRSEPSIIWPILVLLGNGEVLCLNTTVDDSMTIQSAKLTGPLSMYPPADDNYSEDACSILVLETVPPSVVIASNFGELYNCLLLPVIQNQDEYMSNEKQLEYSLHIIETIELELGINISDVNDDYGSSNILQLKNDFGVPSRYWCLHNTGVHSVTIPLGELLEEFSKTVNDEQQASPDILGQSFVEYYICTGLMNGETKPIKGFSVINFPTDLLVTMLSNGEVVTQSIPDYIHNKASIANLYIANDENELDNQTESTENNDINNFSSFISTLLQTGNGSKNTLLKLGSDIPPHIVMQMILQSMTTMREDTIKKHKTVSEEIERRVRMLINAKERQLLEMQKLEEARLKLQEDVENKAEKLDEINNKQEELTKRASTVLMKLVSVTPESVSTKKKRELLEMYKSKMTTMNKRIEELKDKWNIIQQESISSNRQTSGNRSFRLTLEQELVIKGNLSEMGSTILELEKKVRDLRAVVNTISN
ncbi:nuclear pore complex protein Nup88 [Daktulosphaira vitifoliae]|uniref:nuclear pore complex protein Nup88 n=1 Tax=Daktulosphaira vitifoliae TaxID=58002 RepID=UPI0021A9FC84|nr:nuclear pore complex protein Nup88 [Daktulosphaira vitifoliae]